MRISVFATLATLAALSSTSLVGCKSDVPPPPAKRKTSTAASAAVPAGDVTITVGQDAPEFTAVDQTGETLTLSALKGKPVVLYFYPMDETAGCTKEATSFRDAWKDFEKAGIVVIGVSSDSMDSHRAFAKNHDLPFHLVSDSEIKMAKAYGVPVRVGFYSRQTFVIGADGKVKKIYRDVDVSKHAAEVLADLSS